LLDQRARLTPGGMGTPRTAPRSPRRRHRPHTHGLLLAIISLAVGYATITNGGFPGQSKAFAAPVTGLSLPGVSSSVPTSDVSVLRPPTINKTKRAEKPISAEQQEVAAQINAFNATPTAAPATATDDALMRAAAVAPPIDLPPYQVYEVQEGDNVTTIADRFGISPEYIVANNVEIHDSDFLVLGQSILIPAGNGILHEIRYGETLSDIAARYDVDVQAIVEFRANGIASPDDVTENQLVYVPGGVPLPAAPPEAEPVPDDGAPVEAPTPPPSDGAGDDADDGAGGQVVTGPPSSSGLIWPFYGNISSYYSSSHPLGIDIDGFNNPYGSVVAATSGTVIFAGGNACCSYGLYVVIMSPDGIETLYAHLASISVSQGESVAQGQVIGTVGSTGYSTGTHLHFEVIDNGVRVNPLSYLP
jgi:murein DD-endopeptidase MepM/ murein hydrolase activator NlpD